MSYSEFLEKLEILLDGIAQDEKEQALSYYQDYFEDAGIEKQEEVLEKLGSPEKVAAIIKTELFAEEEHKEGIQGEYSESGFADERFREHQDLATKEELEQEDREQEAGSAWTLKKDQSTKQQSPEGNNFQNGPQRTNRHNVRWNSQKGIWEDTEPETQNSTEYHSSDFEKEKHVYSTIKTNNSTGKILLIIALIILTSPIWIAIAGALFGLLVGALGLIIGLFAAAIAATAGLIIAGVVVVIVGIVHLASSVALGIALVGLGMILLSAGLAMCLLAINIIARWMPGIVRGCVKGIKNLLNKIGGCFA